MTHLCVLALTLLTAPFIMFALSRAEKFDVCEEKTGIAQKAKATQLGAKLVDKCFLPIISKYKFTPKMFQRAAYKMCLVFRLCFHKYIPLMKAKGSDAYREEVYACIANMTSLLTTSLNPDWVDERAGVDPSGLYHDGVKCAGRNKVFTEDTAVALFGIKWIRDTLF